MRRPTLQELASGRALAMSLIALAAFSTIVRLLLVSDVPAPTVFNDELGYTKLAQSIGLDGRFALLDEPGFSYSPLYPLLLSPIYALGASAAAAYTLIKVVNAFLISLSVFPLYGIARSALDPPRSLLVVAVSLVAPLMSYPVFTMSESLAYPLSLVALWLLLRTIQAPRPRNDVILLVAIAVATAARIQLIVLLPVALTAFLLASALRRDTGVGRRLIGALRAHWVIFGLTGAALLAAGIRALAGQEVFSVFGRYAVVGRIGLPNFWEVLELTVHHLAGLDLAVGVIPFLAALVTGYAFVRARFPDRYVAFASVAVSLTAWLVVQVAIDAALFDSPGGDVPRIHERFMIYAVPLFLVALLAAVRLSEGQASTRVHLGAVAIAGLLPVVLPFATYANQTVGVDTFALIPFSHTDAQGRIGPIDWARPFAVLVAVTFALSYVRMLRGRLRRTLLYVIAVFAVFSAFVWSRVGNTASFARSTLPEQVDWVDRAAPAGDVVLVADHRQVPALETLYFSLRISGVYTLCDVTVGPEFGEQVASIDADGRLVAGSEPVAARYAVVPSRLGIRGRILARNRHGRQVLVAPLGGRLVATTATAAAEPCVSPRED